MLFVYLNMHNVYKPPVNGIGTITALIQHVVPQGKNGKTADCDVFKNKELHGDGNIGLTDKVLKWHWSLQLCESLYRVSASA
jgi:hypothetical protein